MNFQMSNYTATAIAAVMIIVLGYLIGGIINEREKIKRIRTLKWLKKERIRKEKEERIYQEQLAVVKATSQRYQELLCLSMRYHFDRDIKLQYSLSKTVNSKAQFDHFNCEEYFYEGIDQRFDECEKFIERVYANLTLYQCYCVEMSLLPTEVTYSEAEQKGIPYDVYRRMEKNLCQPLFEEEFVSPTFLIHVNYHSPQGRKVYRRDHVIIFEQFATLFEQVRQRRDTRSTAAYQRKIMSSSLRYDIMKRDGFRCVLCGRSASEGVKLHVDHILPVSRGGKTEYGNLRTLCCECNMGKRDKYDAQGMN